MNLNYKGETMKELNYDELSKDIYQQNVDAGWWDDPNRCIYQTLQLISTEIAEATEGARKDLMDDHLPHRKMEEVELADVNIRLLDFAGRMNLSVDESFTPLAIATISEYLSTNAFTSGRCHFIMNQLLVDLAEDLDGKDGYKTSPEKLEEAYTALLLMVLGYGKSKGYDIESAMFEKLDYNKKRLDHKRENRRKEGGKGF